LTKSTMLSQRILFQHIKQICFKKIKIDWSCLISIVLMH